MKSFKIIERREKNMGFYEILQRVDNNNEAFLDILENVGSELEIKGESFPVCIASFLNGFCMHLAIRLRKEFGYELEAINIDGEFSHMYCVYLDGCKKYYIDCRGITDNFDAFIGVFTCDESKKIVSYQVLDEEIKATFDYFEEDEISNAMCDWYLNSFRSCVDVKSI